jgi:hypothetical protein
MYVLQACNTAKATFHILIGCSKRRRETDCVIVPIAVSVVETKVVWASSAVVWSMRCLAIRLAAVMKRQKPGAFAGRAIEGNARKTLYRDALVSMQNGGTQIVSFEADSGYRVGGKVKITGGGLMCHL